MQVSVTDAKSQLTELVRRAEAAEEIVLTRHGHSVARLTPVRPATNRDARMRVIQAAREAAAAHRTDGPDAAHSQDFLYGDDGMPS